MSIPNTASTFPHGRASPTIQGVIFRNLDLTIEPKSVVALVSASGAGEASLSFGVAAEPAPLSLPRTWTLLPLKGWPANWPSFAEKRGSP